MDELLSKFNKEIISTATKEYDFVKQTIISLYDDLLKKAMVSYAASRPILQSMIGGMSANPNGCLYVQCIYFLHSFNRWVDEIDVEDDNIECNVYLNASYPDNIFEILSAKLNLPYGMKLRIGDVLPDFVSQLTIMERQQLFSFALHFIQHPYKMLKLTKEDVDHLIMILCFMRSVSLKDNLLPFFYSAFYTVIDKIEKSGWHQTARDLAEELLVSGHKDNMQNYAYLGMMGLYAVQRNKNGALLYANCLINSLKGVTKINKQFTFEIIWSVLKMYRIVGLLKGSPIEKLCEVIDSLNLSIQKRCCFYHTYFSVKFLNNEKNIQEDVADFIDSHRECIIGYGENSALPWYTLIAEIKNRDIILIPRLVFYQKLFFTIIPEGTRDSVIINIVNKTNIYESLKESLLHLSTTRDNLDYSIDSYETQRLATQLLSIAYEEKSAEKMLTAMAILNDFSFVRLAVSASGECMPVQIPKVDRSDIESIYADLNSVIQIFNSYSCDTFVWLADSQEGTYITTVNNKLFSFSFCKDFHNDELRSRLESIRQYLNFETSCNIERNGINEYYKKDQNDFNVEAKTIVDELRKATLPILYKGRVLFAKDTAYAFCPHQLIINPDTSQPYVENIPTANFISTEHILKCRSGSDLDGGYKKAFWSPIKYDFGLAQLYAHLEETLNAEKFQLFVNEKYPDSPLSSNLNILCVHGSEAGKDANCFYVDGEALVDMNRIIGRGELLILFVCFSGSMDKSAYDNAIHTIIKKFIRMGYQAVIAPMWALSTEILPLWLNIFMMHFNKGEYVVDALYYANLKVKQSYPTPSAYANLHLFGYPYLRVKKGEF